MRNFSSFFFLFDYRKTRTSFEIVTQLSATTSYAAFKSFISFWPQLVILLSCTFMAVSSCSIQSQLGSFGHLTCVLDSRHTRWAHTNLSAWVTNAIFYLQFRNNLKQIKWIKKMAIMSTFDGIEIAKHEDDRKLQSVRRIKKRMGRIRRIFCSF